MKNSSLILFGRLNALVALSCVPSAFANLIVDGVDNGTFLTGGNPVGAHVYVYNSDPTDPTQQSGTQYVVRNGSTLTVNSGTFMLTNTQFGGLIGQQSSGAVTVNGGSFTWNANGSSEQRFAVGNGSAAGVGTVSVAGGTFFIHTGTGGDTQRALIIGRNLGTGNVAVSGGLLTSDTDRFGLGATWTSPAWSTAGNNAGTGKLTLSGDGVFTLNGLADLDTSSAGAFYINTTTSWISFTSGSAAQISIGTGTMAASQTFFDDLVTSGGIRINDVVVSDLSRFTYTTSGTQGIYQLSAVPEPGALPFLLLGGGVLGLIRRSKAFADARRLSLSW